MRKMCHYYAKHGVTGILATTMTNEPSQYEHAMSEIAKARQFQQEEEVLKESTILGINMEGPFFGKEKKGAHDEQYLREISNELLNHYQILSNGAIRMVDVDPTLDGALAFIRENKDKYVMSIAHTNCDYQRAKEAWIAGASHVTHLFNAMRPLLHREPGVVGAVSDFGLNAEIICDGIHIHPAVIRMMFQLMPRQMILISDSINPTGLTDGNYIAGGLSITVKNQCAFLEDGTLAGSTITLFDAVKNAVNYKVPLEEALYSATYLPACSVHLEDRVGSIQRGYAADLLLVDHDLTLLRVMKHGNWI